MNNGMKILMVSSYLPYPLFSGGDIRLFNLIKNLNENGYKITLICEKRSHQSESHIKKVEGICEKVITVERRKQWSIRNILRTGISAKSFLSVGHSLPEMKRLISEELLNNQYDLIHVETFYVYQNLPETNIPVVLVEHNIEYLVYKRYVEKLPVWFRIPGLIDVQKIKKEEQKYWKKADRLVAVSRADRAIMRREDAVVVPNGVDLKKFDIPRSARSDTSENIVLFIGNFKWIQNTDSLEWILMEIWPAVLTLAKEKEIGIKLWVVGKNIPKKLKEMENKGIIFDENATDSTEDIYRKADLLLAPIRVGGGTSFKILESMATGLPVLTTALGNEGIYADQGRDILVYEETQQFANSIIEILTDKKRYDQISENARKFILENFGWKSITKKLEEVYQSLV